ncbi:MAG: hypothetical protein ACMZ64_02065 [Oleiphilus sp.]
MSSEPLIGLASVLVGALLGLLGVLLANKSNLASLKLQMEHERQSKSSDIKRERLEELYVSMSHWVNLFFSYYFKLTLVMREEIDYNQYLDEVISDGNKNKIDFQRQEMIINIYGRELIPAYDKVLKSREKVNDIAAAHKADYKKGNSGSKYLKPYTAAHQELEKSVENFKKQIAEVITNA